MVRKNKNKNKKGFSLGEVLVTLFVLSIGIVAVSVLMTVNIKNSENAKNQIIASQLAQEGTELVRNLKDNNATFTTDVANGSNYRIDYLSDYATFRASNVVNDAQKRLYLNGSGFYAHAGATATKFFRKISIAIVLPVMPDTKKTVKVTSIVSWNGSGFPATCNVSGKCVSVVSVLPDLN